MRNKDRILFVTPAAPGFYVLTPCSDEGGAICEAALEPVVAWALDERGATWPVTVREVLNHSSDDPAILCPDGQVCNYLHDWDSLSGWLETQKAEVRHG